MGSQDEVSVAFLLARMPGKHWNSYYFFKATGNTLVLGAPQVDGN